MTDEEKLELENALLALQEQCVYIYELVIKHAQPEAPKPNERKSKHETPLRPA